MASSIPGAKMEACSTDTVTCLLRSSTILICVEAQFDSSMLLQVLGLVGHARQAVGVGTAGPRRGGIHPCGAHPHPPRSASRKGQMRLEPRYVWDISTAGGPTHAKVDLLRVRRRSA